MTLAELTSSLQLTSCYLMSNTIITEVPAGGWVEGLKQFPKEDLRSQMRHKNFAYLVCFDAKKMVLWTVKSIYSGQELINLIPCFIKFVKWKFSKHFEMC